MLLGSIASAKPTYHPLDPPGHALSGAASWYGSFHQGSPTANGERFNKRSSTCAHKTLPFGTVVLITDLDTGRTATCRVNDRGPYKPGRIIDCAEHVAQDLGFHDRGTAKHVKLDVVTMGDDHYQHELVEVAEAPDPSRHGPSRRTALHDRHKPGHRRGR